MGTGAWEQVADAPLGASPGRATERPCVRAAVTRASPADIECFGRFAGPQPYGGYSAGWVDSVSLLESACQRGLQG